ncbi:hypothetical protein Lalb_Chr10g0093111 [Lupinus albus]|uniref:Uncharacterized protein n=1 Tax=Lupinus albus TaxID=3870 RepID=A0A6A4PUJ6_LUPAL|nr:hypothetical protein Lalb_Chr10g0093111 [Lupinus albus]
MNLISSNLIRAYIHVFDVSPDIFLCPGFTNISKPCYEEGITLCANRKEYYFWDKHGHTTEAALKIYADDSFSGSKLCFPMNMSKLALSYLR